MAVSEAFLKKVVLIVEDDVLLAVTLEMALEDAGYRVLPLAIRHQEGLRVAREGRADIALVNIELANGDDGVALARDLKTLGIPVVFISGQSGKARLAQTAAIASFPKPYSPAGMVAAVDYVFALERRDDSLRCPRGLEVFDRAPPLAPVAVAGLALLPSRDRPLRALIADDNEGHRSVLGAILASQGLTVEFALNGYEAVLASRALGFDLVLMDMNMPLMGGIAATRLIRDYEAKIGRAPAPLYVVTSEDSAAARAGARNAGADGYISKPAAMARVLEAVRHCRAYACARAGLANEGSVTPAPQLPTAA